MALPEWAGPFGLPSDEDELKRFVLTTAGLTALYAAAYGAAVWHAIPRMAQHHYRNPSRNAIIRAAAKQTVFPSVLRLVTVTGSWPIVVLYGAMMLGHSISESIDTSTDQERVLRAIDYTRGTRDHWWDTSWLVSHGYFHESPHHGDHWYSFNPQDIDGSHR